MSEAAVNGVAVPGWFGKLPNVGDFASRRLPEGFVQGWDRWLQHGLASARGELGERWLAAYLVAPIRRFWLAPGLLGDSSWAGLLMPSVDRVGRHFPLTVAQPAQSLAAALAARDWYRALDAVARRVLDVDFTIDDLEHALASLAMPVGDAADASTRQLADRLLGNGDGNASSLWWCDDADEPAQFLRFDAMPPASAFASMLGATR